LEITGQLHELAALLPGKEPSVHFGGWVGFRTDLDIVEGRRILPHLGLARNYTAYRLRLLYIAVTKGWPAALYYDQEGANEYLDVTPRLLDRIPTISPQSGPEWSIPTPGTILHTPRQRKGELEGAFRVIIVILLVNQ
jgi:hypothetical protein